MTSQYSWARIAGPDPKLRAADADRERVAERLREGHAEGRLDIDELQERLELCYRSKTLGELRELVRDLPRQDRGEDRQRTFGSFGPWPWRLAPLVPIFFALIVISAVAGHHVFWLWIPLLFLFWRLSWWPRRRHWQVHGVVRASGSERLSAGPPLFIAARCRSQAQPGAPEEKRA